MIVSSNGPLTAPETAVHVREQPESRDYRRPRSLILLNGLAEQPESWFCNRAYWSQYFFVSAPAILVYDGDSIQRRLEQDLPISVDYLTSRLEEYLDNYVQDPPYHLVASSLGCQIAVEYAVRQADKVSRLVLLCPSGIAAEERLPVSDNARQRDFFGLVASVFFDSRFVEPGLVHYYQQRFRKRAWRKGAFRTIRDTSENSIQGKLSLLDHETLVICGQEDRIVDPREVQRLLAGRRNFSCQLLPKCGHAPQIESADLVNEMVVAFLSSGNGAL
jgi:pimeloyl-ACP methyl ester carboxylesterase